MKNKTLGLFGRFAGARASERDKAPAVIWQPEGAKYPRLLQFDPSALAGRSGLYLLWHLGVRPQWLRAGYSADLGEAAKLLAKTPQIMAFGANDGPFLSWSFCAADGAAGAVNFLAGRLKPALQDQMLACDRAMDPAVAPAPCELPAGTKDIGGH
jgi:hypothetical protein